MFVHHDVAIMSVFDLQQVTDQRIGSHALDKVGPGLRVREEERKRRNTNPHRNVVESFDS